MEHEILNDVEKAAVAQFMAFDTMREAVKKVLLENLYGQGNFEPGKPVDPLKNQFVVWVSNHLDKPDDVIGANTRALYWALNALEAGFTKLDGYKKVESPNEPKKNKAR